MNRIIAILVMLAILLTVGACSASIGPQVKPQNVDGEITGKRSPTNGAYDMAVDAEMALPSAEEVDPAIKDMVADAIDKVVKDAIAEGSYSSEVEMPTVPMDTAAPKGDYGEAPDIKPGGKNPPDQISSGTLTAAEWRDHANWEGWLDFIRDNTRYEIARRFGLLANKRLQLTIRNGNEPVKNAKVELLDGNGKVLFEAVSDYNGCAYLFYGVKDEQQRAPATLRVTASDGTKAEVAYDGKDEMTLDMAAKNGEVKLDLMFVVDTTGSMGDELEYLKAELRDVVIKAGQQQNMKIRTSVNFYRDEGDEYIVRYFGFKDDISEAVKNISAQYSDGGGDYEEAVHTALDNAVFGHAWDEDSVKLLFLVLDAPPHADSEVYESLQKTILEAARQGIRIIPLSSSGTDTTCEVLFRTWAALTGGTYAFITDHSGIGNPHAEPTVSGEYTVEKLNAMLIRLIGEYCS